MTSDRLSVRRQAPAAFGIPAVGGNGAPQTLLGVVHKSSLLNAYFRLNRPDG